MKYKIKDTSWLYRLYMTIQDSEPTNLCGYFWTNTIGIVLITAVIAALLGVVGFVIYFLMKLFALDWAFLKQCGIVILSVFALGAFSLGMEALERFIKRKWNRTPKPKKEHPFLNMTAEYIKAKKSKICPLVEIIRTPVKEIQL